MAVACLAVDRRALADGLAAGCAARGGAGAGGDRLSAAVRASRSAAAHGRRALSAAIAVAAGTYAARRSRSIGARCGRSEEHTSELQSLMRISYAVFCLKKKNKNYHSHTSITTYNCDQE